MSLQKACLITASIEIALASVFLILNLVTLVVETPLAIEERENAMQIPDPYRFHAVRVVLCGLNTCYWIGCLFLGMILLAGAKMRDLRRLRIWFVLTCILTVVFIVDILMEAFTMMSPIITVLSPTFGTILQLYMLWIVMNYMEEIKGGCVGLVKAQSDERA